MPCRWRRRCAARAAAAFRPVHACRHCRHASAMPRYAARSDDTAPMPRGCRFAPVSPLMLPPTRVVYLPLAAAFRQRRSAAYCYDAMPDYLSHFRRHFAIIADAAISICRHIAAARAIRCCAARACRALSADIDIAWLPIFHCRDIAPLIRRWLPLLLMPFSPVTLPCFFAGFRRWLAALILPERFRFR